MFFLSNFQESTIPKKIYEIKRFKRHFDVDPEENEVLKTNKNNTATVMAAAALTEDEHQMTSRWNMNIYTSETERTGGFI